MLALLVCSEGLWAQTSLVDTMTAPPPQATGIRTTSPPVIDGVPDEAEWRRAPVISGFVQNEPL